MKEPILYKIVRPIINILFKILYHPTIEELQNIPCEGRIILAGNHTSNLDCLLLMSATKRVIHFLAKDSLIKGPFAFIFKAMGIIPVNRRIRDNDALNMAVKTLNEDKVIGIFPESTINKTTDITLPFKSGAVRMAWQTGCPIVPFCITNKYKIFGKSVNICFGKPYLVTNNKDQENDILKDKINTMIIERRNANEDYRQVKKN